MLQLRSTALCSAAAIAALMLAATPASAAEYYKGKSFTFYIGSSPGGGYNRYARTIGHHIAKHIPGKPSILFINMPGAGSRKLTAWYYNIAPKNGLNIAAVFPGAVLEPLFGKKHPECDPNPAEADGSQARPHGRGQQSIIACRQRSEASLQDGTNALLLGRRTEHPRTADDHFETRYRRLDQNSPHVVRRVPPALNAQFAHQLHCVIA